MNKRAASVIIFPVTADTTAPTVATFTVASPSTSLDIPIAAFTASEAGASFLITEDSTPPLAGAAGWSASAPTTYTVATAGTKTLYPWVKDEEGNVSSVYGSPATVIVMIFQFLDRFTTDDNSPLSNPAAMNPGPGAWIPTNTNNALAIANGKLTVAGTTAVNGDGIRAQDGIARADGLTGMFVFDSFTSGSPIIGFALSGALGLTQLGVLATQSVPTPVSRHGPVIQFDKIITNYTAYATIVFSVGSATLGYNGSAWKLLFAERSTTTATLYPQVNNHVGSLVNYALTGYGGAVLGITRSDLVTDGKDNASAGDTITHTANGVIGVTRQIAAGETYEISFRRTDDDNRWILRVVNDTNTITLVKREAGSETTVATNTDMNIVNGGSHWFFIRMSGNMIICGMDGPSTDGTLFEYDTATFNNTATSAKVSHASTFFNSYAESVSAPVAAYLNAMLTQVNP